MLTGGHLNRQNKTKTTTKRKQFTATPQTKEEYELFSYRDVAIYSAALLAAGVGLYVARKRGSIGTTQRTVAAPAQAPISSDLAAAEEAGFKDQKQSNDARRLNRILVSMSQDTRYDDNLQNRFLDLSTKFNNGIPENLQILLDANVNDDAPIRLLFDQYIVNYLR
jgi:hypothetical protein